MLSRRGKVLIDGAHFQVHMYISLSGILSRMRYQHPALTLNIPPDRGQNIANFSRACHLGSFKGASEVSLGIAGGIEAVMLLSLIFLK